MRLKPCNLHFTVAYWRGIQPNHKAVPAIQKIVRSYVTIISTHSSLIKGIIHVEGSGKPCHEWVPVLGDFLRKRTKKKNQKPFLPELSTANLLKKNLTAYYSLDKYFNKEITIN